jgi:hypothetical protein
VVWEGDAKAVLLSFPDGVRQNLGFELWQLQQFVADQKCNLRSSLFREKEPGNSAEGFRESKTEVEGREGK